MDYIAEMLGLSVKRRAFSKTANLPYFLLNEYSIQEGSIGTVQCLFLKSAGELSTIHAIKNQLRQLHEACSWPVVFELDDISRQRATTFIKAKIAFVVPGRQMYLPFMGIGLSEHWGTDQQLKPTMERLQPSAQMLLFAFIEGKNEPLYLKDMVKRFSFSAMTVSRAAKQLVQVGLIEKRNEGVQKLIVSNLSPKDLFMKAEPYLTNPVRKVIYINHKDLSPQMFRAGLSALAEKGRLNHPTPEIWGIGTKYEKLPKSVFLIDAHEQCALELWKYDPRLISGNNLPDALSLAVNLKMLDDERVEQAMDELLAEVW